MILNPICVPGEMISDWTMTAAVRGLVPTGEVVADALRYTFTLL